MNTVRVSLEVNDVQLAALGALLHGKPITTAQRGELLAMHIHIGRQMQEHRDDVAQLLRDAGLDRLKVAG